MLRSLWLKALWAPALTLVFGAVAVGIEMRARELTVARARAVIQMRRELERVTARLTDRHTRTVRRAREALLEPEQDNQIAILSWTSQHYLKEMERHLAEAGAAIRDVAVPRAKPRLENDLRLLERQHDRIRNQAQEFAKSLDRLLGAVSSGEEDVLLAARQGLDREDKAMHATLRVARRIVQRASVSQAEHAATPIQTPGGLWLALLLLVPLSLWLAYRPLASIARLARGEKPAPSSDEERRISDRISGLQTEVEQLETRLGEQTRQNERISHTTRRAEQELALFKLYNENLVNSLRSVIVVTDAGGLVTGFNRAARKTLGMDGSLVGTSIKQHAIFRALATRTSDADADLERAMSEKTVLHPGSVPYARADHEILLEVTIAPYLDESGAARGLIWVLDDVTEAFRARKQLLTAERLAAVGSLSAQVAHEVRNPLSAIGLNAELLEEELSTGLKKARRAEALALLRAIGSEVERLTQITDGYLELTRMPRPELRQADLNQIVGDLLTMLGEELKAHAIDVVLQLATPAPQAWADPGQLRQALLNIVRNSREAMPEGGTLRVATRRDATRSIIEITDTGPGIASDVVPRVFEPFYTTKRDGTGLGLSLTHQIVTDHAGEVCVQSTPPNGTTIRLSLPTDSSGS